MSKENKNAVMVEINDDSYKFTAGATVLRQIIFHIGDLVWPGWFEHEKGRETYIKYADDAKKQGFAVVSGSKYYLTPDLYEEVKRRLKEADVEIFENDK